MVRQLSTSSLIRVICELCTQTGDLDCSLCRGQRFYLWDPGSFLCYGIDKTPLLSINDLGDQIHVTRRKGESDETRLDLRSMIEFIELWVKETSIRKWKLVFDESGWHSCVWFNRYKKVCFEASDASMTECVAHSYKEIIRRSKRKAADL